MVNLFYPQPQKWNINVTLLGKQNYNFNNCKERRAFQQPIECSNCSIKCPTVLKYFLKVTELHIYSTEDNIYIKKKFSGLCNPVGNGKPELIYSK